jgi:hypothetical protein
LFILVGGSSHTTALVGHATFDAPTLLPAPDRDDVWAVYGSWPRSADYWEFLAASAAGRIVALSWHGEESVLRFLIQGAVPFDFVYNNDSSLRVDEAACLVPEALVKAVYRTSMNELAALIGCLQESNAKAVVVISAPPPKRESAVRAGLRREPHFISLIESHGLTFDQVEVVPERLRLKLWRLLQDSIREIARSKMALYLPGPAGSVDQDGFLLDEYSAYDATHANDAYGALVIAELKRTVQT